MIKKNKETSSIKYDYSSNKNNRTKFKTTKNQTAGKTINVSKPISSNKKFHNSIEFDFPHFILIIFDLLFFLVMFFLWGVCLSDFTYVLQKSELFVWFWPYCREIIFKLGGPLEFFTLFFTQFFYYSLAGGIIIAGSLFGLQKMTVRAFHLNGRLYPFSYLPSVLLTIFFISIDYHIFELVSVSKLFCWIPGLSAAFLIKILHEKFAPAKNRWITGSILCLLAYPLIGSFALLGCLLCIADESARTYKTIDPSPAEENDNRKETDPILSENETAPTTKTNENALNNPLENCVESTPPEDPRLSFYEQKKLTVEILILTPLAVPLIFYLLCFRQLSFYYFYANCLIIPIMLSQNFLTTFIVSFLWLSGLFFSLLILGTLQTRKKRKLDKNLIIQQKFSWNKKTILQFLGGLTILLSPIFFVPWHSEFYALLSMQRLLDRQDWDGLIRAENQCKNLHPRQTIMLRFMALYEKKELGENLFKRTQCSDHIDLLVKMSSVRIYGSEYLLRMGVPDFAAKMAMNCLITMKRSGQSFQILGQCAVIMKEYPLAKRYFFPLEHSLFYADKVKPYLDYIRKEEIKAENEINKNSAHPPIEENFTDQERAGIKQIEKEIETLRSRVRPKDMLSNITYPEMLLYEICRQSDFMSASPEEQELILTVLLIIRDSTKFVKYFDFWQARRGTQPIPRHFQEALMVFSYTRKDLAQDKYKLDPLLFGQFAEFMKNQTVTKISPNKGEYQRIKKLYEPTYWYYFFEVPEMPFY